MEELLLRVLEPRRLIAAGVLLGAWAAYARWGDRLHERLARPGDGAPPAESPLGRDIRAESDARESARLRALHARVTEEIEAARPRVGDDAAARLRRVADAALALDRPEWRSLAEERLNRVRMAIPQPAERVTPAPQEEEEAPDVAAPAPSDDPAAAPAPARRPVRAAKARRRAR